MVGLIPAMPYFRVSDQFHNHPKVREAGNAAVGLWVRLGAYSSNYLLDGFIPIDVASAYGTHRELDRLIDSGLVLHVAPDGLLIASFTEHNYTAEKIRAQRATTTERQRRWRSGDHAATDNATRDATRPKPKPKSKPKAAAAAISSPLGTVNGSAAPAAAAVEEALTLFIAHKVLRDQPRHAKPYELTLRRDLPAEYESALNEYLTAHPTATRNDIARAVFGMSIVDIRKAST